jgi:phage terminase Nu1 subunit (DNA packaging protein)
MADSIPTCKVGALARLLNVTERRVQQLAKDGIISKPLKGKYDLVACVQGYIRYLQDRDSAKGALAIDSHVERARLIKAKADKTELEVHALNSTYIQASEVERIWCTIIGAFRAKLLALPSKCSQLIAPFAKPEQIREVLDRQVSECLSELAEHEPERFINPDSSVPECTEATAETDSEPVGGYIPSLKPRSQRRTRKMENGKSTLPKGNDGRGKRAGNP